MAYINAAIDINMNQSENRELHKAMNLTGLVGDCSLSRLLVTRSWLSVAANGETFRL